MLTHILMIAGGGNRKNMTIVRLLNREEPGYPGNFLVDKVLKEEPYICNRQ